MIRVLDDRSPLGGGSEEAEPWPRTGAHTVGAVNASSGEPRRPWWARLTGRGPVPRWRNYALAALWLFVTATAAVRWAVAEDSTGRWLAGLGCCLGLILVIGYIAAAISEDHHRSQR